MPKQKNEYFCETIFCSPNDFQKKKQHWSKFFWNLLLFFVCLISALR